MAKQLRYSGEFVAVDGAVYRVDIMQEADTDFPSVGGLDFPRDSPLTIEWKREDKEKVICGSIATLKVISPGDRTYEDLYTIELGRIRMDIYKNGGLYWSGALDPEFYEEPYERLSGYEVNLTFSDFGILNRLKYDLSGVCSIYEIVQHCVDLTGVLHGGIDLSCISTTIPDEWRTNAIEGLSVRSDNFTDEDGEISTLYDTLEGVLQPLAARIVQRAGKIYVYDLHGLYWGGYNVKKIQWDGDSQTMGVDKVVNNVTVSFSPYSSAKLMDEEAVEYGANFDADHVNLASDSVETAEYGDYYSYYPDYSRGHVDGGDEYDWDYRLVDFTIFISIEGKGLQSINGRYFHILPMTGGPSECSGVAWSFRTGGHGGINTGWPRWKVKGRPYVADMRNNPNVLTTYRVFVPKLDANSAKKYRIRVCEEILIDARYNPFSGSASDNDEGNNEKLKKYAPYTFIPCQINLYNECGEAIYHYSNIETAQSAVNGHLGYSKGKWVAGADPGGDCWLEYYDPEELEDGTGVTGWKGNRHCIGTPGAIKMYDSFKKMGDGEYLPYPPESGYLEVKIDSGVRFKWESQQLHDILRWCLYKAPKVDVVNNNLVFDAAELQDQEYSGYINKAAKEELSIDTICGTSTVVCPTAKGIYHKTSNGEQIQKVARSGRTDHPESLLIGTLYSQYATRKTTLSGEAVIEGGLNKYTEANQPKKYFMLMGETQNLITGCTDAEYCEFSQDEYDSIEEVKS